MKKKLKTVVKNNAFLYSILRLVRRPCYELNILRDYLHFRRQIDDIFKNGGPPEKRGRLLVVSLLGDFVAGAKQEAFLAKALQLKAVEPYIVTYRGDWINRYYKLLGMDRFIYLDDFLEKARVSVKLEDVQKALDQIGSFRELIDFKFHGANVGKYICSTLVRETRTGSINPREPETRKRIARYLYSTMANALAANEIYEIYKPDTTLFLERGYTPFGEFFDLSVERKLNTIQWCGCHRDNSLMLKRYHDGNMNRHPATLSPETLNMLRKAPWNEGYRTLVEKELFQNYSSGRWFSEVGTQYNTRIMEKDQIRDILALDPNKKTAVVFSHLFWDATFFYGEDLFTDYQEWFVETVKTACANDRVNWIIKLHPANVVKRHRDGFSGELTEKLAMQKAVGTLPTHVKILEPETSINTYSLFSLIDYCVTVRGTIGIEAAFFGIPVFTAGTGRYDGHGFTIDSASRAEYLDRLAQIHTFPRLTREQTELAQKFAYGIFLLRPFDLKGISVYSREDAKATHQVDYNIRSTQDLLAANDLNLFAEWAVNSRDDDFHSSTLMRSAR
jgi:hypothetical protein